jgi:hypothetical protein
MNHETTADEIIENLLLKGLLQASRRLSGSQAVRRRQRSVSSTRKTPKRSVNWSSASSMKF